MEKFSIQAEETIEDQRLLHIEEVGEEFREKKMHTAESSSSSRTFHVISNWSLHLKIQLLK